MWQVLYTFATIVLLLDLPQLKQVEVYNSFGDVCELIVNGLPKLEVLVIYFKFIEEGGKTRTADGVCRITDCPKLHFLEIDYGGSNSIKSFELSNLYSLQSIEFKKNFFFFTEKLSLKGEWVRV